MSAARRHIVLVVVAIVVGAVAGCGSGGSVTVSDAWVRAAPGAATTAAYLSLANAASAPDALVSATSPAAGSVMIHQTAMDASGMVGMEAMDRLEVPAGSTVKLEPGASHLMLMDLHSSLDAGATVELDLVFEHAGRVAVQATVR
jgi:copper(I)-binding protein